MPTKEKLDLENLKTNVKRKVQGLRYLYDVMDSCGDVENLEHCIVMAQNYIKHIADELEQEVK